MPSAPHQQSHDGDPFRELVAHLPIMPWRCADDARCDYLGPQWLDYIGEPRAPLGEYCWLEQLHPDDLPSVLASWHAAVARDQPFQGELRLRSSLGSFRWFRSRASPLRDAAGSIRYWIGNSTDIQDEWDARHGHARLVHELRTEMHAHRLVCTNGMRAWRSDVALRMRHVGDPDRLREQLRDAIPVAFEEARGDIARRKYVRAHLVARQRRYSSVGSRFAPPVLRMATERVGSARERDTAPQIDSSRFDDATGWSGRRQRARAHWLGCAGGAATCRQR